MKKLCLICLLMLNSCYVIGERLSDFENKHNVTIEKYGCLPNKGIYDNNYCCVKLKDVENSILVECWTGHCNVVSEQAAICNDNMRTRKVINYEK